MNQSDEQKKNAVIDAAKLIRDLCTEAENCSVCAIYEFGCPLKRPSNWTFPGDPPPLRSCPFCGARIECYEYLSEKDAVFDVVERWNRRI